MYIYDVLWNKFLRLYVKCLVCHCHAAPRRQKRCGTSAFLDWHARLIFCIILVHISTIKGLDRHECLKKTNDHFETYRAVVRGRAKTVKSSACSVLRIRHSIVSCLVSTLHKTHCSSYLLKFLNDASIICRPLPLQNRDPMSLGRQGNVM